MNIEEIREYCLSLNGVTEDMPFGDDVVVYRLEGKIFLCLSLDAGEKRMALKLLPERNEELREQYTEITPAYHWNKKHWSDVDYSRRFSNDQLTGLIDEAYQLIIGKLPKTIQSKYLLA